MFLFIMVFLCFGIIQQTECVKHDSSYAANESPEVELLGAIIMQDIKKIPELIQKTTLTSEHISQLGLLLVRLEQNAERHIFKSITDDAPDMEPNFFNVIKSNLTQEQLRNIESAKASYATLFGSGFGR